VTPFKTLTVILNRTLGVTATALVISTAVLAEDKTIPILGLPSLPHLQNQITEGLRSACNNPTTSTWSDEKKPPQCADPEQARRWINEHMNSRSDTAWDVGSRTAARYQEFDRAISRSEREHLNLKCPVQKYQNSGRVAWSSCVLSEWTSQSQKKNSKEFQSASALKLIQQWTEEEYLRSKYVYLCHLLHGSYHRNPKGEIQSLSLTDQCTPKIQLTDQIPEVLRKTQAKDGTLPTVGSPYFIPKKGSLALLELQGRCSATLRDYNCIDQELIEGLQRSAKTKKQNLDETLEGLYPVLRSAALQAFASHRAIRLLQQHQIHFTSLTGQPIETKEWKKLTEELTCFDSPEFKSYTKRIILPLNPKQFESDQIQIAKDSRSISVRIDRYDSDLKVIHHELIQICGLTESNPRFSKVAAHCKKLRKSKSEIEGLLRDAFAIAPHLQIADPTHDDLPLWRTLSATKSDAEARVQLAGIQEIRASASRELISEACDNPERFAIAGLQDPHTVSEFMAQKGNKKFGWLLCSVSAEENFRDKKSELALNSSLALLTLASLGSASVSSLAGQALSRTLIGVEATSDLLAVGIGAGKITVEYNDRSDSELEFLAGVGNLDQYLQARESLTEFYLHAALELGLDAVPVFAMTLPAAKSFLRQVESLPDLAFEPIPPLTKIESPTLNVSQQTSARATPIAAHLDEEITPAAPLFTTPKKSQTYSYRAPEQQAKLTRITEQSISDSTRLELQHRWQQIHLKWIHTQGSTSQVNMATLVDFRSTPSKSIQLAVLSTKDPSHHFGLINWRQADTLVDQWIRRNEEISIEKINELNRTLGAGLPNNGHPAGNLRSKDNEFIAAGGQVDRIYVIPNDVMPSMTDLIAWIKTSEKAGMPPIELAARTYQKLISIHPYFDGNGRTSRLVMDWILKKNGLPPAALMGSDEVNAAVFTNPLRVSGAQITNPSPESVIQNVTTGIERSLEILQTGVVP